MKRRQREDSSDADNYSHDDSSSNDSRRRRERKKRKKKKSHKRKHSHKSRKHRLSDNDSSDESRHRKKYRRRRRRDRNDGDSYDDSKSRKLRKTKSHSLKRKEKPSSQHLLADALCNLLEARPCFSTELPVILIRLAGGATIDLDQMTDEAASFGLRNVFESLASFGVQKSNNLWLHRPPPGGIASNRNELVLLNVIRSLLNDIGLTQTAVETYEIEEDKQTGGGKSGKEIASIERTDVDIEKMKTSTVNLLKEFQGADPKLGEQLVDLCETIISGESLCIDGVENSNLKDSLAQIFLQMGLKKSEMENDDSDDDENEEAETLMGYGLPENDKDRVKMNLAAFMETCQNTPRPILEANKRRVLGPQPAPNDLSEDDEGPAQFSGMGRKGPILPPEVIQARMEKRQAAQSSEQGGREQWMLEPGKHDFLSSIKSGQSIKSRGFRNEKAPEERREEIHPVIQREMDSIMEAHKAARGPSLLKQHREKKQQEKNEATGKKSEWKWNRDSDLDSGRRVDKNALKMVLGGAASNLQSKFQGGFNR